MTRPAGSLLLFGVFAVAIASNCAAAPQDAAHDAAQDDPRAQVRTLAARGELEQAERRARDGGGTTLVALGDVLVLRGRLASADSAYRLALSQRTADHIDAEIALAELAKRRGDHQEATRRARAVLALHEEMPQPARGHLAAGRAWVLLSTGNAEAPRRALEAFDRAAEANPRDVEPLLRVGDLFLERYNAPDAKASFEEAIKRSPGDARALLGLARVEEFAGSSKAIDGVRKALAANGSLVPAQVLLARLHLEAEAHDSATHWSRRALATDSASMGAWALLGATAWLSGDSATFRTARDAATRLQPRPSEFYVELAEAAVRQRRYADAVRLARTAVELDSTSVQALGVLGTNQLRIGAMDEGRASLDRAFALDAYNVWHKNTLDLLDKLREFRTIDRGRFRIVAPAEEADLLALYIIPLLEQAYDSMALRYGYRPPTPVRLEFYRHHADFSVRTVGLAGLGALGVSFGSVLAMDAPSARERGTFNWGSTAWHELMHAFSLGASGHRVPRWFSEGLSVLEERRAGRGWGADVSLPFIAAYAGGQLRPVSRLNEGFLYPRQPTEVQFSYYLASLFCEMVEEQRGVKALTAMLTGWRDGHDTPAVFRSALGMTPAQVDERFDAWMRTKFAAPLRSVVTPSTVADGDAQGTPRGPFVDAMRNAASQLAAGRKEEAIATLEKAQALFPQYAGADSPAWMLAQLHHERGDLRKAVEQLARVTMSSETAWEANQLEAEVRMKLGDTTGAMAALERLVWISPYDVAVHARLAELALERGDHATSVRERRAIIALDPADPLDARYELARALAGGGDIPAARRELMDLLERAPQFEKAQLLLLDLRDRGRQP